MNKEEKIIESIWDELELSLTESGHPFHIQTSQKFLNKEMEQVIF